MGTKLRMGKRIMYSESDAEKGSGNECGPDNRV